jgi:hypothetical protein
MDETEIRITHGYSKDHRPDLKQAVLELVTSQDAGVPLMMKWGALKKWMFQPRKLIKLKPRLFLCF